MASPKPANRVVGQTAAKSDPSITANVHTYRQPVAAQATTQGQDGVEWGAADVEVCAGADAPSDQQVSHLPWSLALDDGTTARPSNVRYPEFPKPGYPVSGTSLEPGACVRGWITFAVPAGGHPARIEWHPSTEPVPLTWKID